jgi:PAS domain S-box-containing protein
VAFVESAERSAREMLQQVLLGDALEYARDFGVFVLDEHGRYLTVNDRACELSGYDRDEIVGRAIGSFNPHLARRYAEGLAQRRLGGRTFVERKDGTRIDVCYRASETRVSRLPFVVVVFWPADPDDA